MIALDGDNICVECGLCCNGTLLQSVDLVDTDDVRPLLAIGATIALIDGQRRMVQPCVALDGSFCTVYVDRPALCRTFKCELLRRRDLGEVTTADARAVIAQALQDRDPQFLAINFLGRPSIG